MYAGNYVSYSFRHFLKILDEIYLLWTFNPKLTDMSIGFSAFGSSKSSLFQTTDPFFPLLNFRDLPSIRSSTVTGVTMRPRMCQNSVKRKNSRGKRSPIALEEATIRRMRNRSAAAPQAVFQINKPKPCCPSQAWKVFWPSKLQV